MPYATRSAALSNAAFALPLSADNVAIKGSFYSEYLDVLAAMIFIDPRIHNLRVVQRRADASLRPPPRRAAELRSRAAYDRIEGLETLNQQRRDR